MPTRALISKEMATFLSVLAHPHRVRLVEELRDRELDVNSMQAILEVSHSRVSQHLSVLRSHRVVAERRDGRHVFYRLLQPKLAVWLLDGIEFLQVEADVRGEVRDAIQKSREIWSQPSSPVPSSVK
jgi:DNA-binding transcriptional ArsR family regulator